MDSGAAAAPSGAVFHIGLLLLVVLPNRMVGAGAEEIEAGRQGILSPGPALRRSAGISRNCDLRTFMAQWYGTTVVEADRWYRCKNG